MAPSERDVSNPRQRQRQREYRRGKKLDKQSPKSRWLRLGRRWSSFVTSFAGKKHSFPILNA
jgi:hypothetical protein